MYSKALVMFFDLPTKASTKAAKRAAVSFCKGGGFILTHGGGALICRSKRRLVGCPAAATLLVGIATAESGAARMAARQV
jgi:hypothetical protein